MRYPPLPSLDTLCQLQPKHTDLAAAKKLLGAPATESQDSMHASLSYRFQRRATPAPEAPVAQRGRAAAGKLDRRRHQLSSVSLYMTFDYSDGSGGLGTKIFGIGGSISDLHKGYMFVDASVEGFPYPSCWPSEEPY
jgi:hypothetical protein